MPTKPATPPTKTVLATLTPDMTRKQKIRNLKAALEKSGFTILPDEKLEDEGGPK